MQLRWEQLDPLVAAKVAPRVAVAEAAARTRRTAETQRTGPVSAEVRPLEPIWSAVCLGVAVFVVALYACVFFHPAASAFLASMALGPLGIAGFIGLATAVAPVSPTVRAQRQAERAETNVSGKARGPVRSGEALQQAFQDASLARAERLYGEVILSLAGPVTRTRGREEARLARTLLQDCNRLLDSHARLELQRRRVAELYEDGATLVRVNEEYAELQERWERETDAIARAAFRESLELCGQRRESLEALEPTLTRLEAHQEVICQALLLAHAALVRRRAAPAALNPPEIGRLRDTARRIANQTRAEEEALTELTRQ